MDLRVSGHQMATGAALQTHAEDRMTAMVGKYFSRALSSHVTFGKAPAGAFRCDIVTHVMHGLILKGAAVAQETPAVPSTSRKSSAPTAALGTSTNTLTLR